jgi:dihydropteroate synthase
MDQPLDDIDHVLNGIERNFAVWDPDIKFLFQGEQELDLVQRIKADTLDRCLRPEPLLRKIEIFKKQFFNAFQGAHDPSTSLFAEYPAVLVSAEGTEPRRALHQRKPLLSADFADGRRF